MAMVGETVKIGVKRGRKRWEGIARIIKINFAERYMEIETADGVFRVEFEKIYRISGEFEAKNSQFFNINSIKGGE